MEHGSRLTAAISPLAWDARVRSGFRVSPHVVVCDCTAREGEQAAEVNFNVDVKVELISLLDQAGVPQAQVGYPGKSPADATAVRRLRERGVRIRLEVIAQVFGPAWRDEVDAAVACGPDILDIQVPCSDARLRLLHGMTREEMRIRADAALRYARGRVPVVRFAPTDTTRADLEYVRTLYHTALDAGADRLTIADTAGAMFPPAMRWMVGALTQEFPVPFQIHCHNDFGLALANTLAAVEAGATIVDASVNGLGERAGHTSLDELVVALEVFYGVATGVRTELLYGVAHQVAQWSGVPVPTHKPLVGDQAFAHKLEGHVQGVTTSPPLYEPIPPEAVGNRRRIAVGAYTGTHALRAKLHTLGVEVSEPQARRILDTLAQTWQAAPAGAVSDAALLAAAEQVLKRWRD
jgi:2-isopropylmalate synthase